MTTPPFKSDVSRLALLMGLCSAIGIYLIATAWLISVDGIFYIGQAQKLDDDPLAVVQRYPPGYPFLLRTAHGVASLLAPDDSLKLWVYSGQAVTLLCRVLALIPLYLLGKLLVGGANSFWALLVLVFLPYPARYGSDVLREWPYLLVLSTGVLLLYWGLTTGRLWALGPVGLAAGLGHVIRPESAQLIVYGVLGLFVARHAPPVVRTQATSKPLAGLLMAVGFLVPVVPHIHLSGGILPQQLRPIRVNRPPVISSVGPEAAAEHPLEFEVREGQLLELAIQAFDPDGDPLTFSLAGVPAGSRPMYGFRHAVTGARFWTIREDEKDLVLTWYPHTWEYEGIAWYAYAQPDVRPGLRPVHRFWSADQNRHFFTMSELERETILTESAAPSWTWEQAVFYAFGESAHPEDAAPVYRFWHEKEGFSWSMVPAAERHKDTIAWYAHPAQESPAGARIEDGVFRWRPGPGQEGGYQVNVIVTDGRLESCQLVTIRVISAGSGRGNQGNEGRRHVCMGENMRFGARLAGLRKWDRHTLQYAGLGNLAEGTWDVLSSIAENFMFILLLPWGLGLYSHLKLRAGRLERALIPAILIVNVGLMFGRHLWVTPGSDRRYSLALVALTIFYVPVGLDLLAQGLSSVYRFRTQPAMAGAARRSPWFYLLVIGSIALCTPKLMTPLRSDKVGYRAASEWLREHTGVGAVVAVPDPRVAFYAERRGLRYGQYPDWKADYVVRIDEGHQSQIPTGWEEVYSVAVRPGRGDRRVVVYSPVRAEE